MVEVKEKQVEIEIEQKANKEPETTPLIEAAKAQADRLEAANKKQEELLQKQEELMSRQTLGGSSNAGEIEVRKEESAKEYKDRILRGEI